MSDKPKETPPSESDDWPSRLPSIRSDRISSANPEKEGILKNEDDDSLCNDELLDKSPEVTQKSDAIITPEITKHIPFT